MKNEQLWKPSLKRIKSTSLFKFIEHINSQKNTKINDLVHIGNSVLIKENTLIMANVDISARVEIGSECWIAQSSCIQQGVKVGNNVQVGMGSVVTKNVRENSVVYGNPAKFIRNR